MPVNRANAASMLRCEANDGSVSYVSARVGNATCRSVSLLWQAARHDAPRPPDREPALPRHEATTRIYTYVEDGVRHYLSRRPLDAATTVSTIELHFIETCNLCAPADDVNIAALTLDTRSWQREIDAASAEFGIDSALVRAVIHAESAYRANAISHAGAQGLMQLMPATALRFGVGDAFDAGQNIRGGVRYLSWLYKRFGGDLDRVLAAYNSGEAAVDRYNGVPPYDETRAYVSRVKALAVRYRRDSAPPAR